MLLKIRNSPKTLQVLIDHQIEQIKKAKKEGIPTSIAKLVISNNFPRTS